MLHCAGVTVPSMSRAVEQADLRRVRREDHLARAALHVDAREREFGVVREVEDAA